MCQDCAMEAAELGLWTYPLVRRVVARPVFTTAELAKIGYDAYGERVSWKNFRGARMPAWEALPAPKRAAWCSAAEAMARAVLALPAERAE